jgi:type VI protein secretion system component Hcp
MAIDMFLKLGDIKGESKDSVHKKEIDIHTLHWGMTQSGSMHQGQGKYQQPQPDQVAGQVFAQLDDGLFER